MKQNITIILLIVLIAISTLLLVNVLTKNRMPDDSAKEELIKALNNHIQDVREEKDMFRGMYLGEIAKREKADSIAKLQQKVIINNYEKISPAVDKLSDHELYSDIIKWAGKN